MRGVFWAMVGLIGLASAASAAGPVDSGSETPLDPSAVAGQAGPGSEAPLDQLIQQFNAGAPQHDGVQIDGWVERGPDGPAVVLAVVPRNGVKLVADPGITVTPTERPGIHWRGPLPQRKVEPGVHYFTPPAMVRLPFTASDDRPVELRVEYAYCVVDFQCFLGEETLSVATRAP